MTIGLTVRHDYLSLVIKFAEPKGRITITQNRSGLKLSMSGIEITDKDFYQIYNTLDKKIKTRIKADDANYGTVFDALKAEFERNDPKNITDVQMVVTLL